MADLSTQLVPNGERSLELKRLQADLQSKQLDTLQSALPVIDSALTALSEYMTGWLRLAERELEVRADLYKHIASLKTSMELQRFRSETARAALDGMTANLSGLLDAFMALPHPQEAPLAEERTQLVALATTLIEKITVISIVAMRG